MHLLDVEEKNVTIGNDSHRLFTELWVGYIIYEDDKILSRQIFVSHKKYLIISRII